MLAGLPVAKLSRQRTVCPSRRKCSQRLEPMNPAPPVISSFMFIRSNVDFLGEGKFK